MSLVLIFTNVLSHSNTEYSLWLEQRKQAQGLLSLMFNERIVRIEIYPYSVT